MKKILMTLAAVLCCAMITMAQTTPDEALKQAEKKAKQAEKKPTNGKLQYEAAMGFLSDDLGERKDFDRALTYANRAFKIAQEHPAPQDTLKGLSCFALGMIYIGKQSMDTAMDFMEMAMDGFQEELGRNDPVTIGTKLIYGSLMLGAQPLRAFPKIQDAFNDNDMAPRNKRIENMQEANILQEMAVEMLIAEQTKRFRHAVPMIVHDGKTYLVVQTKDWNIERPLVGWMVPDILRTEDDKATFKGNNLILYDENHQFIVVPDEEKDQYQMIFDFKQQMKNPRQLQVKEGNSHIWFLNEKSHHDILTKFRAFISTKE
ncbi:MAG: hypothetical protein IKQ05_01695 [Prevotella sp.]|nr:hypothetical protein [Prevotella sp.]